MSKPTITSMFSHWISDFVYSKSSHLRTKYPASSKNKISVQAFDRIMQKNFQKTVTHFTLIWRAIKWHPFETKSNEYNVTTA